MASKPGERKLQILQTLAGMLEKPSAEKITTAALAAKLDVSEAALYRHFASKAQMFEGLIGFIEETVFGLVTNITAEQKGGLAQIEAIITMLLAAPYPQTCVRSRTTLRWRANSIHSMRWNVRSWPTRSSTMPRPGRCASIGGW